MMPGLRDFFRHHLDACLAGLLFIASFLIYCFTLAPTVLFADGGEFQFAPYLPGFVHPTGYPLYVLLGWLWSHLLPFGDPAYRLNLFSAFWSALALAVLYRLMIYTGLKITRFTDHLPLRLAAFSASLFVAFGPTYWSESLIAEVYSFHGFLLAAILSSMVLWLTEKKPAYFNLLVLALGLGLAHHRTTILIIPALLLAALMAFWKKPAEFTQAWPKKLALPVTLFCAPLLLYLTIPIIAAHTPYAVLDLSERQRLVLYESTLTGFIQHISGAVFAAEVRPGALGESRLAVWLSLLYREVGLPGLALWFIGLSVLTRRRAWLLLVLTTVSYAALVIFNLIYFIGDIDTFFSVTYLLGALWLFFALAEATESLAHLLKHASIGKIPLQTLVVPIFAVLLAVSLPAWQLSRNWSAVDQSANTRALEMWQAIFAQPIPPDAVLLSNDRNEIMPMWYEQYVNNQRRDLLGLFPLIVPDPAYADIGGVLDQALASGRDVFLIKPMPGLEVKADFFETEGLIQARPIAENIQHRVNLNVSPTLKVIGVSLYPLRDETEPRLFVEIYWQASGRQSADLTTYIHLLDSQGQAAGQSDHPAGGAYYPTSLWKAGETLRDLHELKIQALPRNSACMLVIGAYQLAADGNIRSEGQSITIPLTCP